MPCAYHPLLSVKMYGPRATVLWCKRKGGLMCGWLVTESMPAC